MRHYKSTLLSITLIHDSAYIIVCMPQLTITIQYIKIHPNVSFGCINVRRLGSTEDILWSSGNYYNVKLFKVFDDPNFGADVTKPSGN